MCAQIHTANCIIPLNCKGMTLCEILTHVCEFYTEIFFVDLKSFSKLFCVKFSHICEHFTQNNSNSVWESFWLFYEKFSHMCVFLHRFMPWQFGQIMQFAVWFCAHMREFSTHFVPVHKKCVEQALSKSIDWKSFHRTRCQCYLWTFLWWICIGWRTGNRVWYADFTDVMSLEQRPR